MIGIIPFTTKPHTSQHQGDISYVSHQLLGIGYGHIESHVKQEVCFGGLWAWTADGVDINMSKLPFQQLIGTKPLC